MIKRGVFGILVVFLIGFVWAANFDGSTTETVLTVDGCTIAAGSNLYSATAGDCFRGDLAVSGYFFCEENTPDNDILDTTSFVHAYNQYDQIISTPIPNGGCNMGDDDFDNSVNNYDPNEYCCPYDYTCEEVGSGVFQCLRGDPETTCTEDMDEEHCTGYYYDSDDDSSTPNCLCVVEFRCEDYVNSDDCVADDFDATKPDICGSTFSCENDIYTVLEDDCACTWTDGEGCGVDIAGASSFNPSMSYSCSVSSSFSPCNDQGVQTYTSDSTFNDDSGYFGSASDTLRECLCGDSEGERACGTPIVKLPFFSIFSLLFALVIIGAYFVIENKRGLIR